MARKPKVVKQLRKPFSSGDAIRTVRDEREVLAEEVFLHLSRLPEAGPARGCIRLPQSECDRLGMVEGTHYRFDPLKGGNVVRIISLSPPAIVSVAKALGLSLLAYIKTPNAWTQLYPELKL